LPNPEDCHRDGYLRLSGGPSKQLPTNQRSPVWRSVPKSLALPIELTARTCPSLLARLLDFAVLAESDDRPVPDLRASDADRERAVLTLGRAAGEGRLDVDELEERLQLAYAARTHAELERLLADVGGMIAPGSAPAPAPAPAPRARVVRSGARGTSWIVSIMGGNERTGRWRIAERCNVVNFMGGSELDLNDAELSGEAIEVNVFTMMGGFEIRVPDGVDVQVSKFAFMGGHEVALGREPPPPGAPVIRIRLISMMGGGQVHRGRKRRDRRSDRELER
jgi:hypothetical protein